MVLKFDKKFLILVNVIELDFILLLFLMGGRMFKMLVVLIYCCMDCFFIEEFDLSVFFIFFLL